MGIASIGDPQLFPTAWSVGSVQVQVDLRLALSVGRAAWKRDREQLKGAGRWMRKSDHEPAVNSIYIYLRTGAAQQIPANAQSNASPRSSASASTT
ncbi:hypothetical protein HYALB_00013756 [Hymenoscyphus albidus]|uniref:Uncharacterized protein n=1 Tax=Hymenoscyphus albidus TaxID=595503 RepID=A0A9N9QBU5_9HELO|nr:hypothetical protein HYALB_00013756 [Hymenoscyphus albidus]